jgi:tetratricopeptide (TPR) repeat protein
MTRAGLLALLLLWPGTAAAGPVDLMALGRQEFDDGEREFNLGHYPQALDHFETAYRLTARPPLLFNVGVALQRLWQQTRRIERLEQAIERFRSFLAAVPKGDPATEAPRRRVERELALAEAELARERVSRAQGEEALTLGEELLRRGQLDEARAQLERYQRGGPNERSGVARASLLRGSLAVALDDEIGATRAYLAALSLDRGAALPSDAPEAAQQAFAAAQEKIGSAPPCTVTHGAPGSLHAGAPVELAFARLSDPAQLIAGLVLHYRAGGGAFSKLPQQPVGRIALPVTFSSLLAPGTRVEYYAEVVDADGNLLQHVGTAALPYAVQVAVPPARSIARRGWFWGVMAGVAALAATGIALAVHYTEPPPPTRAQVTLGERFR